MPSLINNLNHSILRPLLHLCNSLSREGTHRSIPFGLIFLFSGLMTALGAQAAPSIMPSSSEAGLKPQIVENYGKLPLSFEVNQGQTAPDVKFLSRGPGYGLFLTPTEAVLLNQGEKHNVYS
jgi:hypothetical protein